MNDTKPIPVRMPKQLIVRLDAAAARIGNTRAGVIRYLTETWVEEFERKGKQMLPADWEDVLKSFDGRRAVNSAPLSAGEVAPASASAQARRELRESQLSPEVGAPSANKRGPRHH